MLLANRARKSLGIARCCCVALVFSQDRRHAWRLDRGALATPGGLARFRCQLAVVFSRSRSRGGAAGAAPTGAENLCFGPLGFPAGEHEGTWG